MPCANEGEEVERLSGLGFTLDEISIIMDISGSWIKQKYGEELKAGSLRADAAVLTNLARMATSDGPEAGKAAIFWVKVRRRWHEVQRVIHGFDPEMLTYFIRQVVQILRREIPAACPHCKTQLDLSVKVSAHLKDLSEKMRERIEPSQIVPMPRPELAGDTIEDDIQILTPPAEENKS